MIGRDAIHAAAERIAPGLGRHRGYLRPIAGGLLITAAAVVPFTWLAKVNATVRPDLPWAALVTLAYLGLLLAWLHGVGPPRRTSAERRRRLRLWPPQPLGDSDRATVRVVLAALLLLSVLWVAVGRISPLPDLGAYPTTAYRWSMFLMGGVVSGVVEEAAFRGWMQTGLEQHDPGNAIWITSLVFVALHLTHGIGAVLLLGPGFFVASMLYGVLAQRSGTIIPGMLIHVLGDLAHTYFGILRGDVSRLFVP